MASYDTPPRGPDEGRVDDMTKIPAARQPAKRGAALDAANSAPHRRRRLLPLFLLLALLLVPLIWLARRQSGGNAAERARADSVALPVGDGSTGANTVAGTSGFTVPQAGTGAAAGDTTARPTAPDTSTATTGPRPAPPR